MGDEISEDVTSVKKHKTCKEIFKKKAPDGSEHVRASYTENCNRLIETILMKREISEKLSTGFDFTLRKIREKLVHLQALMRNDNHSIDKQAFSSESQPSEHASSSLAVTNEIQTKYLTLQIESYKDTIDNLEQSHALQIKAAEKALLKSFHERRNMRMALLSSEIEKHKLVLLARKLEGLNKTFSSEIAVLRSKKHPTLQNTGTGLPLEFEIKHLRRELALAVNLLEHQTKFSLSLRAIVGKNSCNQCATAHAESNVKTLGSDSENPRLLTLEHELAVTKERLATLANQNSDLKSMHGEGFLLHLDHLRESHSNHDAELDKVLRQTYAVKEAYIVALETLKNRSKSFIASQTVSNTTTTTSVSSNTLESNTLDSMSRDFVGYIDRFRRIFREQEQLSSGSLQINMDMARSVENFSESFSRKIDDYIHNNSICCLDSIEKLLKGFCEWNSEARKQELTKTMMSRLEAIEKSWTESMPLFGLLVEEMLRDRTDILEKHRFLTSENESLRVQLHDLHQKLENTQLSLEQCCVAVPESHLALEPHGSRSESHSSLISTIPDQVPSPLGTPKDIPELESLIQDMSRVLRARATQHNDLTSSLLEALQLSTSFIRHVCHASLFPPLPHPTHHMEKTQTGDEEEEGQEYKKKKPYSPVSDTEEQNTTEAVHRLQDSLERFLHLIQHMTLQSKALMAKMESQRDTDGGEELYKSLCSMACATTRQMRQLEERAGGYGRGERARSQRGGPGACPHENQIDGKKTWTGGRA